MADTDVKELAAALKRARAAERQRRRRARLAAEADAAAIAAGRPTRKWYVSSWPSPDEERRLYGNPMDG